MSVHVITLHDLYRFDDEATRMGELFAHLTDDHDVECSVAFSLDWLGRLRAHEQAHAKTSQPAEHARGSQEQHEDRGATGHEQRAGASGSAALHPRPAAPNSGGDTGDGTAAPTVR